MANDGGLRDIFRDAFPSWQWNRIETGIISPGLADSEFCSPYGLTGWIEFKFTKIFYVQIKPLQVAWLEQRWRYGQDAWIGVRRTNNEVDELWVMKGNQAKALKHGGLNNIFGWSWKGGPSNWNFDEIAQIFSGRFQGI